MRPMSSQSDTVVGSVRGIPVLESAALDVGYASSTPAALNHLTNALAATTLSTSQTPAAVAATSCRNVSLMIPVRPTARPLPACHQSHRDTATVTSASHSTQLVVCMIPANDVLHALCMGNVVY